MPIKGAIRIDISTDWQNNELVNADDRCAVTDWKQSLAYGVTDSDR